MLRVIAAVALLASAAGAADRAPVKKDEAEKASDSRDKVICKRFVETGSLVRGYRICKTKAEWERERDNIRQLAPTQSCRTSGQGFGC